MNSTNKKTFLSGDDFDLPENTLKFDSVILAFSSDKYAPRLRFVLNAVYAQLGKFPQPETQVVISEDQLSIMGPNGDVRFIIEDSNNVTKITDFFLARHYKVLTRKEYLEQFRNYVAAAQS